MTMPIHDLAHRLAGELVNLLRDESLRPYLGEKRACEMCDVVDDYMAYIRLCGFATIDDADDPLDRRNNMNIESDSERN